jgi:hypothetical protein
MKLLVQIMCTNNIKFYICITVKRMSLTVIGTTDFKVAELIQQYKKGCDYSG